MKRTILIVEDEQDVAELLNDYLQADGYETTVIANGLDVVSWVRQNTPDLVLLDLMLPGKDGISICREIREFSSTPIIMATAKVNEIDRLLGLELGADDYICKPFSLREVVARVKAVLRRSGGEYGNRDQPVEVDKTGHRVLIYGKDLGLTIVEFNLFVALNEQPGRILSRQQLIDHIYDDYRTVSDRTVDSHISKLRLKIAKVYTGSDLIHSVYGIGYRFEF